MQFQGKFPSLGRFMQSSMYITYYSLLKFLSFDIYIKVLRKSLVVLEFYSIGCRLKIDGYYNMLSVQVH